MLWRFRHVVQKFEPSGDLVLCPAKRGPPRVGNDADGATLGGEPQIGVVGSQGHAVLAPAGEHPIWMMGESEQRSPLGGIREEGTNMAR